MTLKRQEVTQPDVSLQLSNDDQVFSQGETLFMVQRDRLTDNGELASFIEYFLQT